MEALGGPPTAEGFSHVCSWWNWDGRFGWKADNRIESDSNCS